MAWVQATNPPFNNMKIIIAGYYFAAILAHDATKFPNIDTAIETMGNNLAQALCLVQITSFVGMFFPRTYVSTMWCQIVLRSAFQFASELPSRRTFFRTQWVRLQLHVATQLGQAMACSVDVPPNHECPTISWQKSTPWNLLIRTVLRVQRQTAMTFSISPILHRTNELGWNTLFHHRSTRERFLCRSRHLHWRHLLHKNELDVVITFRTEHYAVVLRNKKTNVFGAGTLTGNPPASTQFHTSSASD